MRGGRAGSWHCQICDKEWHHYARSFRSGPPFVLLSKEAPPFTFSIKQPLQKKSAETAQSRPFITRATRVLNESWRAQRGSLRLCRETGSLRLRPYFRFNAGFQTGNKFFFGGVVCALGILMKNEIILLIYFFKAGKLLAAIKHQISFIKTTNTIYIPSCFIPSHL